MLKMDRSEEYQQPELPGGPFDTVPGRPSKDRFDFEQDIMACWNIVDDIDQLVEMILDRDASKDSITNVLAGLSVLYGDRFTKLMSNFEKLIAKKEI